MRNGRLYEDLREHGESQGKAVRILDAKAAGTLDQNSEHLENRTMADLYGEAKDNLVKAIRKG